MLDWKVFTQEIAPSKADIVIDFVQIDSDHQLGLFHHQTQKILYFGFIQCASISQLPSLIQAIEDIANRRGCKKIIGPIDGATWANYRFQSSIQIQNKYPGQPTYSADWANIFLKYNYKVSETYETVQIDQIEQARQELLTFKEIELPDLQFIKPTKEYVTSHVSQFQQVLNEVFTENYQFSEMTITETKILFSNLLNLINYDFSLVIIDKNNEIVGFMLNYTIDDTLYLKTIGIKKLFRYQGLTVFKMLETILGSKELSYQGRIKNIVICLMKKDNFPSLLAKYFNGQKNEYVLLEKTL